ncbi:MAG: ATP-binding cassette domain-containing protein, partial [Rhodospirillaceae bacterium]
MTPLLQVENLDVSYGGVTAVRGLSLTVGEGEVVSVLGPNGAGKSTTLAAIAGGVTPQQGRISFGGVALVGCAPED